MKNQKKDGAYGQRELFRRKRTEIPSAERLQTLQAKLYEKAKRERDFKFYVLYDKTFIPYILEEAWKLIKSKNSSAGIDGRRFCVNVEKSG